VKEKDISVEVCIYMFDLLYLNGSSILGETFEKRRNLMREHFQETPGKLIFATHLDTDNFEEIQDFFNESKKIGCEGLMIKTLQEDSTYEPSKRTFKWLKLKKDYLDTGLEDTFDLVPIGALKGIGKRTGMYGSFLLACYNPDFERYETCCMTGTGFSDQDLKDFYAALTEYQV